MQDGKYGQIVRNESGEGGRDDQIRKDRVCYSRDIGLIIKIVEKH